MTDDELLVFYEIPRLQKVLKETPKKTIEHMTLEAVIPVLGRFIPKKPNEIIKGLATCECGAVLDHGKRFCFNCGQKIDWSTDADK